MIEASEDMVAGALLFRTSSGTGPLPSYSPLRMYSNNSPSVWGPSGEIFNTLPYQSLSMVFDFNLTLQSTNGLSDMLASISGYVYSM